MQLGLITRSKGSDYAPLSRSMRNQGWWRKYDYYTQTSRPTLIVEGAKDSLGDSCVRFFVAGIQSDRQDKVGTPIRFSIFGSFKGTEATLELPRLLYFFRVLCRGEFETLGSQLDDHIDEELLERYFSGRTSDADSAVRQSDAELPAILNGLDSFWRALKPTTPGADCSDRQRSVTVGRENRKEAEKEIASVLLGLAKYGAGRVLFLNLAGVEEYRELRNDLPFAGIVEGDAAVQKLKKNGVLVIFDNMTTKQKLMIAGLISAAALIVWFVTR